MSNPQTQFHLDYGTRPATVDLLKIEVQIDPGVMVRDFAVAYCGELRRRNAIRFDASGITEDELYDYFKGLMAIRVECVQNQCKVWRQAKQLLIPSFIQFVLTQVGLVRDREYGLEFIPIMDEKYDIQSLLEFSIKLNAFESDGLVLHRNAFPREVEGDADVMSMAIITEYVFSRKVVTDPMASYVSAFLGMKLQQEASLKMLYRVKYEDVAYIRSMLMTEPKVII